MLSLTNRSSPTPLQALGLLRLASTLEQVEVALRTTGSAPFGTQWMVVQLNGGLGMIATDQITLCDGFVKGFAVGVQEINSWRWCKRSSSR